MNAKIIERANGIHKQLKKVLQEVDNLGIDNYPDIRWLQDYLHEEVDRSLIILRMLISKIKNGKEV